MIAGETLAGLGLAWMPTLSYDTQAVLATDKVRFQGQEVAFVVAEDRYAARDALELIDVEYEPLPPVVDARRALDRSAGDPRRQGASERQPHLRLVGGRQGRSRRGLRGRRRRGGAGHALPAGAPGAVGDLRHRGRHGRHHREADGVVHHPGPARPPHDLRDGVRHPGAQDPDHLPGHRGRLRQQGRHLPRLRVRGRRLDRHRQAGEVGGGPLGEPDEHLLRPRLPHARTIAATKDGRILGLRVHVIADHGAFNATAQPTQFPAGFSASSPAGADLAAAHCTA